MSASEYREWARPFDSRILRAAAGAPFNVLHVCKRRNLLMEVADYPVSAFSWASTDEGNPTLAEALARVPGAVMGGISHDRALAEPAPERALAELARGLEQTGGRRWLVAPGCSIPPATRPAHLRAIRDAVESMRLPEQPSG
jgi:uroporphyrinogen decarboxylase